jgi:hypothetical protein
MIDKTFKFGLFLSFNQQKNVSVICFCKKVAFFLARTKLRFQTIVREHCMLRKSLKNKFPIIDIVRFELNVL